MTSKDKKIEVEIGTKEQVIWQNVAKEAKILIEQGEQNLIVQKAILIMAEKKIAEEQAK